MSSLAELTFTYDAQMHPVSATCSICGEHMPAPPPELLDTYDLVLWYSVQFIAHKSKHGVHH